MKFGKDKFSAENGSKKNKTEALSEKEKRLAREIKELPASIMDKINLILVWRGLKPCTKLTYVYKKWNAGDPEPDLTTNRKRARVLEFNQLLGSIGLSVVAGKEERKEPSFETLADKTEISLPGKEYREYCIAPSLETAQKLADGLLGETKTEINEAIMTNIQKLSPELYAEMIREQKDKSL